MALCEALTADLLRVDEVLTTSPPLVITDTNLPAAALAHVAEVCRTRGIPLWGEPTTADKCARLLPVLSALTFLSPNREELEVLVGRSLPSLSDVEDAARTLVDRGVRHVFVTLGAEGVLWVSAQGGRHHPSASVPVADVTGAGDAFTAGAVWALMRGERVEDAVDAGIAASLLAIQVIDSVPPALTPHRLLETRQRVLGRPGMNVSPLPIASDAKFQTVVSCLYDLARYEGPGRKPLSFYLDRLDTLMQVPTPLVLFVDPAIADLERFRQLVAQRAPERTTLVRRPLEDLPRHRDLARVEALPNFQNAAPEKDTARYLILNCSKLDMLREAIHQNDHGTDFFAWMDAGIAHVARPPDVFPHASHGVAFLQMRAVSLQETASRNEFYARERGRLAAAFFRGSGKRLLDLAQAFSDELDATLASGLRANEQMVLSRLSAIRPELFELYYGDYSSVLCNWDRIRDGIDVVFLNLAHCREHGLWATSIAAATPPPACCRDARKPPGSRRRNPASAATSRSWSAPRPLPPPMSTTPRRRRIVKEAHEPIPARPQDHHRHDPRGRPPRHPAVHRASASNRRTGGGRGPRLSRRRDRRHRHREHA